MKFLILLFIPLLLCQSPPEEVYENTPKVLSQTMNSSRGFVFQVSKDFSSNSFKDVIIYGTSNIEPPSSLEIFISTHVINRSDPSSFQLKCYDLLQMNPCVFSFSDFGAKTVDLIPLYFTIVCRSQLCSYTVKIYHISPVFLEFEKPEMFKALRDSGEIFNFTIPEQSRFDRVVLQLFLKSETPRANRTSLRFSRGNPLIFRTESRIIAVFNRKDPDLCFNCNLTMFLDLEKGLLVELEVFRFEAQSKLSLNKAYFDLITSSTNIYNITVFKNVINKGCLNFRMRSISGGEKTLFVNPATLPDSYVGFAFNSTNPELAFEYENDIEICEKDLTFTKDPLTIFLAVKSSTPKTVFFLEVRSQSSPVVEIKLGTSENGRISPNSLKYFQLEVFKTEANEGRLKLYLNKYNSGLSFYSRVCVTPCPLITNEDAKGKNQIAYYDEMSQDTILEFHPRCVESVKCYYLFAVLSSSRSGFFSLVINRVNSFIELIENRRHESHLDIEAEETYRLSLFNELRNVQRVSFMVSADISYEIKIYNETNEKNASAVQAYLGNEKYPVSFEKGQLEFDYSQFVVKIRSQNTGFYWIVAQVERDNSDASRFFMKITEGSQFSGIIDKKHREVYLQYINKEEEIIEVELILRSGPHKLQIFISESPEIPSAENHFLKGQEGFFTFLKSAPSVMKYNILVQPRPEISLEDSSLSFDLTVSTNKTLKLISKSEALLQKIGFNQTESFLFIVNSRVSSVSVAMHLPSQRLSNAGLVLEFKPNPKDTSIAKALLRYNDGGSVSLAKPVLLKLCKDDLERCEFFLEISSKEPDFVIYSLNVGFDNYALEVKDSIDQKIPMKINDVQRLFYYIRNNSQPLEITLRGFYPDFEVFIGLFDNRQWKFDLKTVKFPDNGSNFVHSHYQKSHFIRISQVDIQKKCWPKCILLLSIHPNPDKPIKEVNEATSFSLLINGDFMELPLDGRPKAFSLQSHEFRYCYLPLAILLRSGNGSLTLSMTHVVGEGGFYLKISDTDQVAFPDNFDFLSYDGHLTLLFHDIERFIGGKKMNPAKSKLWISIYCRSNDCESTLSSHITRDEYQLLFLDMPLEISMRQKNDIKLFRFKNTAFHGFKLKFNRVSGIGRLNYGFCDQNVEFFEVRKCFKSEKERPSVFFAGVGESHLTVRHTEPGYCNFCDVAVSLENLGDLKGTLLVLDLENFALLQEGKTYYDSLESLESNKYRILVSKMRETVIKISRFSGNVDVYISRKYETNIKSYSTHLHYNSEGVIEHVIPPELGQGSDKFEVAQTIFIVITSMAPSNYSITFRTGQMPDGLSYGVLDKTVVSANSEKSFYFQSLDQTLEKSLTLMVSDSKNLLISFQFRGQNQSYFSAIALTENIVTENSYLFPLPKGEVGTYLLRLKNIANSSSLPVSIILNSIDAIVLPLNSTIHGYLGFNSYKYYEVFIENPGYLVLDFKECTGVFEATYTKNYKSLFLHEFEGTFSPLTRGSGFSKLKVDQGMIYFAIHSIERSFKPSLFELTALYYEGFYDIPESHLVPGEEGRLRVTVRSKDKQSVGFWPVKCTDFCDDAEMRGTKVEYFAEFSEGFGVSKCSGEKNRGERLKVLSLYDSHHSRTEQEFDLNAKKGMLFVSLRAVIHNYRNHTRNITIYYQELDLNVGAGPIRNSPPPNFYIFLAVFIALLLILSCYCGKNYWSRCFKSEQTLTYEMQDVRNVVQIRGVNETVTSDGGFEIDNPTKSYVGLVEE